MARCARPQCISASFARVESILRLVAVVESSVGGVVSADPEVGSEGRVVDGVEVEGKFAGPFGKTRDLNFQHVVVGGKGDESGFGSLSRSVEMLEGCGVAFAGSVDDIVVTMPAGSGVLIGIDEKNHPFASLGFGEGSAGVKEEGDRVFLGGDANVGEVIATGRFGVDFSSPTFVISVGNVLKGIIETQS